SWRRAACRGAPAPYSTKPRVFPSQIKRIVVVVAGGVWSTASRVARAVVQGLWVSPLQTKTGRPPGRPPRDKRFGIPTARHSPRLRARPERPRGGRARPGKLWATAVEISVDPLSSSFPAAAPSGGRDSDPQR